MERSSVRGLPDLAPSGSSRRVRTCENVSMHRRAAFYAANVALAAALIACGTKTPAEPLPPAVQTTTITITSTGASPRNIELLAGQRVLFINNDDRSHNMTSDPHPEHDACP